MSPTYTSNSVIFFLRQVLPSFHKPLDQFELNSIMWENLEIYEPNQNAWLFLNFTIVYFYRQLNLNIILVILKHNCRLFRKRIALSKCVYFDFLFQKIVSLLRTCNRYFLMTDNHQILPSSYAHGIFKYFSVINMMRRMNLSSLPNFVRIENRFLKFLKIVVFQVYNSHPVLFLQVNFPCIVLPTSVISSKHFGTPLEWCD